MSGVRCFVAIPLPACLVEPLVAACEAIRETDHAWRSQRWVAPENIHVTLKFFGSLPEGDIAPLGRDLAEQFADLDAFDLPFSGLRPVRSAKRATMIWATFLDPEGSASALAEAAERASLEFGVEPEERTFKPHATLVRARRPMHLAADALQAAEQVLSSAPRSVSVHHVTFISSQLTPRGPVYNTLDGWDLKGR